jgi:hypothetical protein
MLISIDNLLLHLIRIALFFFLFFAILVPTITLFLSWRRNFNENKKKTYYEKYENEIFQFLYYKDSNIYNIPQKLYRCIS